MSKALRPCGIAGQIMRKDVCVKAPKGRSPSTTIELAEQSARLALHDVRDEVRDEPDSTERSVSGKERPVS